MIHIEMPFIHVLSKIDLMESYGRLAFNLEYYTQVQDLEQLLPVLNKSTPKKFRKLNESLIELIDSFNLVSFYTLQIEDKYSVLHLARAIDKANGYVFGGLEEANESIMCAGNTLGTLEDVDRVEEKYLRRGMEEEEEEKSTSSENCSESEDSSN